MKIANTYYISYYYENNTCALTNYDYGNPYVEFPDENGNNIKYIVEIFKYNNDIYILGNGLSNKCYNGQWDSVKCIAYSQYLSNQYINNFCSFNDETPIIHCDDVYSHGTLFTKKKSLYMYYGKIYQNTCKKWWWMLFWIMH